MEWYCNWILLVLTVIYIKNDILWQECDFKVILAHECLCMLAYFFDNILGLNANKNERKK